MKLREGVTGTHAWDFAFCEGDTIKEKYESLYEMVRTLALHKSGKAAALVICNHGATSGIVVTADLHNETTFFAYYQQVTESVRHLARIERSCGDNGYNTDFELYEDKSFPEDEVLVINGNDKKVIKLFNFVF